MIKGFKKFCLCLLAAGAAGGILAGCNSPANRVLSSRQEYAEQMQAAVSSPFSAYPETVVYTLGKMISTNNSNMRQSFSTAATQYQSDFLCLDKHWQKQ